MGKLLLPWSFDGNSDVVNQVKKVFWCFLTDLDFLVHGRALTLKGSLRGFVSSGRWFGCHEKAAAAMKEPWSFDGSGNVVNQAKKSFLMFLNRFGFPGSWQGAYFERQLEGVRKLWKMIWMPWESCCYLEADFGGTGASVAHGGVRKQAPASSIFQGRKNTLC
jgi:hypothetical protein